MWHLLAQDPLKVLSKKYLCSNDLFYLKISAWLEGREYGGQGTQESFQMRLSALGLDVCLCFCTELLQ